nr:group 1 truncated hemoglobin [Pseudoalteromonas prydzensis]
MLKFITIIIFTMVLSACSNMANLTLYQQLDGKAGLERLVDSFINQIGNDEQIIHYFEHANISHFREGFINHLCVLTNGPCEYTRDSMVEIHTGMHITEADFNHVVDLLINAMNEQNIDHTVQNKILAKMAPLRSQIIKI